MMCEPRSGVIPPGGLEDLDPTAAIEPRPTDSPAVRRWKLRLSDRLGMGTFGVGTLSAYLLWSIIQGFDDMRVTMRDQAAAISHIGNTLERVQTLQRDTHDRYAAWETQSQVRFADLDGRLSVLRRDREDDQRLIRDHDTRLRVLELERHPPTTAPRR